MRDPFRRMWAMLVAVLLLVSMCSIGWSGAALADPGTDPDPVPAADTVDEIHYSFGDSADSVVLDWHGDESTIYYGTTADYGSDASAEPSTITPANGTGTYQEVRLTDLAPGTDYHYRIGTNGLDHTLQTVPTGDFSWVDVGDTMSTSCHGDGVWMTGIHDLIARQHPAFVTHGGDIAVPNQCGLPSLHQYYVDQQAWSMGAAFQPALGNHEYGRPQPGAPADAITDSLSNYKGRSFVTNGQTVPTDTPSKLSHPGCSQAGSTANTCQGEDWGWFRAGHVLFISYPEPWSGAWTDWREKAGKLMAEAQSDPAVDFVVTWGHRPPYTSSVERPNTDIRAATQALAKLYSPTEANPDGKYVLSVGHHAHSMEAFKPIGGLTYITAAAGGQGLTRFLTPDPSSVWRKMHLGILSGEYDATDHSLSISMLCGGVFPRNDSDTCDYGSTSYTTRFQRPVVTPQAPASRLTLSYGDSVSNVAAGDTLSYVATVTNDGDAAATGVSLTSTLPARTTLISADDDVRAVDGSLTWTVGDLAPGDTATRRFTSTVDTVDPGAVVSSTAQVTGDPGACASSKSSCQVTDTDTVPPQARDWVENSGLETDLTGWFTYNASTRLTRVTDDGSDGSASAQLLYTKTRTGTAGLTSRPITTGTTVARSAYTASVWVKPQKPGQSVTLKVREVTGSGGAVGASSRTVSTTAGWQRLEVSRTASQSGNRLILVVTGDRLAQNTWVRADQLSLVAPN